MVRGLILSVMFLSAGAAHAGVSPGEWNTTNTTTIFAETTTETGEACLASEESVTSAQALAAAFAERSGAKQVNWRKAKPDMSFA